MSLLYRKKRIKNLALKWKCQKLNDLFMSWEIPNDMWEEFCFILKLYISKALEISFVEDEKKFIKLLDKNRNNRKNITPNGAVVPKKEYQLEYNLLLKCWCEIIKKMVSPSPNLLDMIRITPNIRIKYGKEVKESIGRSRDTNIPHSDAWLEGPLGIHCHIPILGDVKNSYLQFYKLRDESSFNEKFLSASSSFKDMNWVLKYYKIDDKIKPLQKHINLTDYSLIHRTFRKNTSGTRVSLDTTIYSGKHAVHPKRSYEYLKKIPHIGKDTFVIFHKSVNDSIKKNKSPFEHYSYNNYKILKL